MSGSDVATPAADAPNPMADEANALASPASAAGSLVSNLASSLNPFSGGSFLPNAAIVLVGLVMMIGALLISQKQTIVQVGRLAA
jgi:hypothetical protein